MPPSSAMRTRSRCSLLASIAHTPRATLTSSIALPEKAYCCLRCHRRSRILAALSGATIIVEAGSRSGSLHTAAEAEQLGRFVGAVPGPITSAASTGANLLLQGGHARVITKGSDIVHMLEGETSAPSRSLIREGAPHLVSPKSRVL